MYTKTQYKKCVTQKCKIISVQEKAGLVLDIFILSDTGEKLMLYLRTKGVKQKYLLNIYLIGSVQTILTIAMFNTQLYNWLINDESIPLLYSAPSSSGQLAIDESAPPPPQVLDEQLAPPLLDLWDPQSL